MPTTVIASPAERFVLCQIIFQAGEDGKPLLEVHNAEQGRAFRRFLRALFLEPIRQVLSREGRVSDELVRDESYSLFEVPNDGIEFFKTKLLNLPRTALQEAIAGDFLDSLHGLGPPPYGRDPYADTAGLELGLLPERLTSPSLEDWTPKNKTRPASGMWLPFKPLQLAMDEFSAAIETGTKETPLPAHVQAAIDDLHDRVGGLIRAALATTT